VKENASARFALSGPRFERILRRNDIDRDASSARSFRGAWVVYSGCTRRILQASICMGRGTRAGVDRDSG
jgi:hypothetical protein